MKSWSRSALTELRESSQSTVPGPRAPPMRYTCDLSTFPEALRSSFVELGRDEETEKFLAECEEVGLVAYAMTMVLRRFWSVTDANGYVGAGQMFVFSQQHVRRILNLPEGSLLDSLLDIGAGDGNVTRKLAPLFNRVTVTELSLQMTKRLEGQGYTTFHTGDISPEGLPGQGNFSVVSLLNVLDRCDKPMTMLRQIKSLLNPNNGVLLIAVVLPFRPFVENGTEQLPPTEKLGLNPRAKFDAALVELVEKVFVPAGFTVKTVSRVPYISHSFNNSAYPYCTLDDALFVLAPNKEQQ